jgi:aspartyl/asparaginyl beta-hydroxylase (cupin superfamily)
MQNSMDLTSSSYKNADRFGACRDRQTSRRRAFRNYYQAEKGPQVALAEFNHFMINELREFYFW